MTSAEFGKFCGVSKPSITYAIQSGRVIPEIDLFGRRVGIDPEHPTNTAYRESCRIRLDVNRKISETQSARKSGRSSSVRQLRQKEGKSNDYDDEEVFGMGTGFSGGNGNSNLPSELEMRVRRLIQQERKDMIANAEKLQALVPREYVEKKVGKIINVFNDHVLPSGERVAVILAAELGLDNPDDALIIKRKWNEEMSRALNELKRILAEGL